MSRITQEIARSVARQMTEKKTLKLESIKKELQSVACELAKKMIPKEVLVCFEKYPSYFNCTTNIQVGGQGLNWEYLELEIKLPSPNGNYLKETLKDKDAIQVKKLIDSISKLDTEIDRLKDEIGTALLSLKTYNRVQTEFPEAYTYLPIKVSQELTVNINKVREKLNQL